MQEVRVRFAPSPTGPLHIGGVRTALYNYLFAKKHNGKLILRIEDTDQVRLVKGAEEYIIESLKWCGIEFDEGVHIGGPYGPYKQSERKHIYKAYAEELVKKGFAYYAFDTTEELENTRKFYENQKKVFQYNADVRMNMRNSLSLPQNEVTRLLENGVPYVIRFKIPENRLLVIKDLIRGEIQVNTNTLDDKVLFKSDGLPTYHLANIVDDHLMKITHVIRGEEWLPSLPLHYLLYEAFGWKNTMPVFAHLPLILKPDGKGKLSKRDGDKGGFPVFPCNWISPEGEIYKGYKEWGFLPDAFINMLALLGWNPGTEQEIFTKEELINLFDLEKVNKAGAHFDPNKAKWFNQQYIRMMKDEQIANIIYPQVKEIYPQISKEKLVKIISVLKERVSLLTEFITEGEYFFTAPKNYDENIIKKKVKKEILPYLEKLSNVLLNISFDNENLLENSIHEFILANNLQTSDLMISIRISLVGTTKGPHLTKIMSLIGKDETIKRIKTFLNYMNN